MPEVDQARKREKAESQAKARFGFFFGLTTPSAVPPPHTPTSG